ncbi:MAG: glycosyltransferase family 4 protein [Luteolibacter sp.]
MRIFTCTPVAFGGGPDFFARDSGLLCRGLQAIGVDSRAVMPGERRTQDEEDLIRTDYRNLESPEWWRSHQLDGVVLYAWGRPKFRKVAAAIRKAGVFLVLNQDSGGLVSPLAGFPGWLREQWILGGKGRDVSSWLRTLKLVFRGMSVGLLVSDPLRAAHLRQGAVIACVSPVAAAHYRRLCRVYGGNQLAGRVRVVPHPVETRFESGEMERSNRIVCVGRWQDVVQKRPRLLMDTIGRVLRDDPTVEVAIAGRPNDAMTHWHGRLQDNERARVTLSGVMGRAELAGLLAGARVFYSPSAYESFGIAAAEALCSGCSVVAARSVSMSAFEWFVSENSGRLVERDNADGHCAALLAELRSWQNGERHPAAISRVWCGRLHADKVAEQLRGMLDAEG